MKRFTSASLALALLAGAATARAAAVTVTDCGASPVAKVGKKAPPELLAVEVGCRAAVLLSRYDLSCGWDSHVHDVGHRVVIRGGVGAAEAVDRLLGIADEEELAGSEPRREGVRRRRQVGPPVRLAEMLDEELELPGELLDVEGNRVRHVPIRGQLAASPLEQVDVADRLTVHRRMLDRRRMRRPMKPCAFEHPRPPMCQPLSRS